MAPAEASLRGKIGAYRLHATHDARETTAAARHAFLDRFFDEVDPDRTLSEAERFRRAEMARKAHFALLAYKSARARAAKKASTQKNAAPRGPILEAANTEGSCVRSNSPE